MNKQIGISTKRKKLYETQTETFMAENFDNSNEKDTSH